MRNGSQSSAVVGEFYCQQLASIAQCLERSFLLLVTSASDLPVRTRRFCFVYLRRKRRALLSYTRFTARYSFRIEILAYPTCVRCPRQEYCRSARKTKMVWLPDGHKILKICLFILTEFTNVTDGRTDTQAHRHRIGRACIASRGKN